MSTDLRLVDWDAVTPAEAMAFRERWDASADERDRWLRDHCPVELDYSPASLPAVWAWLRGWVHGSMENLDTPTPVFWDPPLNGSPTQRRYAGVETVVGYLEQVMWRRYPDLVPAIARTPTAGQMSVMGQYAPGLDWASRVKGGAAVDTADLAVRMGHVFDNDPDDEYRLGDWLVRSHSGYERALADSKKVLARRMPPAPKAKVSKWRDPDDLTYAFEVWFDEETMEDYPSITASTAEWLAQTDGISEAYHHDSNAILIATDLNVRQVRSVLREFVSTQRPAG